MISFYACFAVLILLRPRVLAVSKIDVFQLRHHMTTLPETLVYPMVTFPK